MAIESIKKSYNPLRLKEIPTLITDTSRESYDYFVISDLAEILTAGKNYFKITGNPDNLKLFTEVLVEVYDVNDNVVYSEFNSYLDEGDNRYCTIIVYSNVPSGVGSICMTGIATHYKVGKEMLPVPAQWRDKINLKWIIPVQISTTAQNISNIVFDTFNLKSPGAPIITIDELYVNVPNRIKSVELSSFSDHYDGNIIYKNANASKTSLSADQLGLSVIVNKLEPIQINQTVTASNPYGIQTYYVKKLQTYTQTKSDNLDTYLNTANLNPKATVKQQVVNPYNVASNLSDKYVKTYAQAPYYANLTYIVKQNADIFDQNIYKPTTLIGDIRVSTAPSIGDVESTPAASETFGSVSNSVQGATITIESGSFGFNDKHVGALLRIEQSNIQINSPKLPNVAIVDPYNFEATILKVISNNQIVISSPYLISTVALNDTKKINTITIDDFKANSFDIIGIETASYAPTHVYKSYALFEIGNINPIAGSVDRINIYHKSQNTNSSYELLGTHVLCSTNFLLDTLDTNNIIDIGNFKTQSILDDHWQITHVGTHTEFPLTLADGNLIHNAMHISGSLIDAGVGYAIIEPKNFECKLFNECIYNVLADIMVTPSNNIPARMDVYITGSAFPYETLIAKLTYKPTSVPIYVNDVKIPFKTKYIGYANLKFKVYSGDWNIANLELKSAFEYGFNPSHTKFALPVNPLWEDDILDFKFEFLNTEGKQANECLLVKNISFANPAPTNIQGRHNLLSGSMYIGNALGSGIEMAGVNSGYLRSIGYEGFNSASNGSGAPGFMIWSGSVLPNSGDNYSGVGLELVGAGGSFKFRTTPSVFEVITKNFFVGDKNSNYLSGSNGNLVISSSDFYLDENGHVIIGGNATVSGSLFVQEIKVPTVQPYKAAIYSDGKAFFSSASIGGFTVNDSQIIAENLILDSVGIIQTKDFVSSLKGWKISSEGNGTAEFENARIRGTLKTVVFEKETVNAVGGQLWVANSTQITGSLTAIATEIPVKNASSWVANEIILIKKVDNSGFFTEYCKIYSSSLNTNTGSDPNNIPGILYVTRSYGTGLSGSYKFLDGFGDPQSYEDGQVIVSTGRLNTGFIKLNANPSDINTPYIDIVERTGSGIYDVDLVSRLGDLSGIANYKGIVPSSPGYGLFSDNVYLQGKILAREGTIGGVNMSASSIYVGTGTYNNLNTSFYLSSSGAFSLKDKLTWDGTNLNIIGSITIQNPETATSYLTASITEASASAATANYNINNLDIGGRNLILNGNFSNGSTNWVRYLDIPDDVTVIDGKTCFQFTNIYSNIYGSLYQFYYEVTPGEIYTISFYVYLHAGQFYLFTLGTSEYITTTIDTWVKISRTVTAGALVSDNYIEFAGHHALGATYAITDVKLERGNVATDYTPAPEDVDTSILAVSGSTAAAQITASNASSSAGQGLANAAAASASSAYISSSLIFNDPTGKLNKTPTTSGAGLFLGSNNLGYYNGSKWATYMSSSGEFYLTGSNGFLIWNPSTDSLSIKGTVNSTNGTIGGFTIGTSTITATSNNLILNSNGTITASLGILLSGSYPAGFNQTAQDGTATVRMSIFAGTGSYDTNLMKFYVLNTGVMVAGNTKNTRFKIDGLDKEFRLQIRTGSHDLNLSVNDQWESVGKLGIESNTYLNDVNYGFLNLINVTRAGYNQFSINLNPYGLAYRTGSSYRGLFFSNADMVLGSTYSDTVANNYINFRMNYSKTVSQLPVHALSNLYVTQSGCIVLKDWAGSKPADPEIGTFIYTKYVGGVQIAVWDGSSWRYGTLT